MIDAAAARPHEQILRRTLAAAGELVMVVQVLFGLFDYAGMENMGVYVNEHEAPEG